jgi:hypothetical protein
MGSGPKATFSTDATIAPSQNQLLNDLVGLLETGVTPAGVQSYGGTYSAPLSPVQNASLAALEEQALTRFGGQFEAQAGYQAPKIDATEAFRTGVVQPVTDDFLGRVLPGIAGKYGAGAGGAFSSDSLQARQTAGENTSRALAQQGSQFALGAGQANQQADIDAARIRSGAPGGFVNALLGILTGGGIQRDQAQQQVTGEYGNFLNQIDQRNKIIQQFIASFSPQVVQTSGVGSAGSTGILPGLLQAGGTLGAAAITKSDERVKEDMTQVGDVGGIPLYAYRYIGDPTPRVGFSAQEVERVVPHAVYTRSGDGVKHVDYAAVLEAVL